MSDDHGREPARLTRWEILSAWLGLWKPRDVEVPPVPKRKLAIAGAALAVLLVVAAAIAIPAIRSGKDEGEARERAAAAQARAERRERVRREQAAKHGRGRPARDAAARAALLERVRDSIAADARRRVSAGQLDGTIRRVECRLSPRSRGGAAGGGSGGGGSGAGGSGAGGAAETGGSAPRASFGCTAVTSDIPAGPRNVPGSLGHPFVAVVDFRSGRYTWCKTNPVPGEQVVPDPRDVVELPRECVL